MRVLGANCHFRYGPEAGDAGSFRACVHHASVRPLSDRQHTKVAFFFRESTQGERRAKRGLGGGDEQGEEELAKRRRQVALELEAANLEARQKEATAAFGANAPPLWSLTASAQGRGHQRTVKQRCGVCAGCVRYDQVRRVQGRQGAGKADCGSCYFCRDKNKFGGKGIIKQICITRWCEEKLPPQLLQHARRMVGAADARPEDAGGEQAGEAKVGTDEASRMRAQSRRP